MNTANKPLSLKERLAMRAKPKTDILTTEIAPANIDNKGFVDSLKEELKTLEVKEEPKELDVAMDDLLDSPLGKVDSRIAEEARIATEDIVPRIRQLESLSDMEAEAEMKLLKDALMANPEAVALMLPEDVGLLVQTLRRITKEAIVKEAASKTKKTKEAKVDAKTLWSTDVDDF